MRAIESIVERLYPELSSLEVFLKNQIHCFEKPLQPLVSYCLEVKGKRLRPIVLFLCAGESVGSESAVKAAAIVELVHIATLVHDDVLDGAYLRHSRPTLAKRYGSESAILLGDALFAHALELSASYPSPWVCGAVARSVRRVCAGEIQQTLDGQVNTLDEYEDVISLKTGELFQLSAQLGAFFSSMSPKISFAFSQFGLHLGSAYQMLDDILDVWGQESVLGKTLGTDALTGKKTLPHLVGVGGVSDENASGHQHLKLSVEVFLRKLQSAKDSLIPCGEIPQVSELLGLAEALFENSLELQKRARQSCLLSSVPLG